MNLLAFSQETAPRLPLTIRWPLTSPAAALPPDRRVTPNGIEATYRTTTELYNTIYLLSMINQAADLGGTVETSKVQMVLNI